MDDPIVAVEKDDIDREAHEKHVHQHEGFNASTDEEQPFVGIDSAAAEQTAGTAAEAP
jgi:hypothetical protein